MSKPDNRPWRTNVGLRLSDDLGAWLGAYCAHENRTYTNFIETLIMRERKRLAILASPTPTQTGEGQ